MTGIRRPPRASPLVVLCGLLLAVAVTAAAEPVQKSRSDHRDYEAFSLANGLRVVVVSDPRADKAAASLDVKVGSSRDPATRQGLSHFLEHMLFLGTRAYPGAGDYQQFISSHGGSHNAYTAFEDTNYFFDVDANHLEAALDRFSQFFIAPLFVADYVQRERSAVDSEYQSKFKDDGWRLMHAWKSQANPAHPFTRYFGGNAETLADLPGSDLRAELIEFWRREYSADRMTLAVLGREPTAVLRGWVETRFAAITSGAAPAAPITESLFRPGTLPLQVEVEPVREQRRLSLMFPVPPLQAHLDTLPTGYIGNLLGHEGRGSLLSLLKQRGWAEGLHAGTALSHADSAMFSVGISLTSAGLAHVDDIVREVFAYIDLVRAEGVQQRIFEENRKLAEFGFRYSTPAEPQSAVTAIAASLHHYPASEVLRGPATIERYDPQLIGEYLAALRPDNLLLVLAAPGVRTDARTRFFDAPYAARPIEAERIAAWRQPGSQPLLAIPAANEFVPERLVVKPLVAASDRPRRIIDTPLLQLWHQQDATWRLPRADFYFSVRSPRVNSSARASVLGDLFVDVVNDQLNEFSYPAMLAGLDYRLYRHTRGFSVRMSGYDERQPRLLERLATALRSPTMDEARFDIAKEELLRRLHNASKDAPYTRAMDELGYLLLTPAWSDEERIEALEPLKVADLREFAAALLAQVSVVALAHGNLLEADARALVEVLMTTLLDASEPIDVARIGVVKLSPDTRFSRTLVADHADAAVALYFQGEGREYAERARFLLLGQMLSAPFYTDLRTEKQLGYVVFATPFPLVEVPGVAFVAQSPVADVMRLELEINRFLADFATRLTDMSAADFDRDRAAVLARVREEDTSLSDRSRRYWAELDREQHEFDTRERTAESIEQLDREAFGAFYRRALLGEERRELSVRAQRAVVDGEVAGVQAVVDVERFKAAHGAYTQADTVMPSVGRSEREPGDTRAMRLLSGNSAPRTRAPSAAAAGCGLALPVLALAYASPLHAQFVADAYESAPQVNAGRLLSPEQLQSAAHRLRDEVRVDASGNLLVFELESDFGNFEVSSELLLRERVHEVQVLAQAIDQFRRADAPLAQRLRGQLEVGAESWVDIVTSPFSTSGQLLGQLAGNVGQTLEELGEFPEAPGRGAATPETPREDTALAAHRRNIASQLQLDPYTSNPRVQSFLDAVAQARAGGRASASALSARVAGSGLRMVANGAIDAAVQHALTRNTPEALQAAIAETLQSRDVPQSLVHDFLYNPSLSMRHRSVIAAHLDFMLDVDGAEHVIAAARRSRDEVEALAFEAVTRMFALYHEGRSPLARFAGGRALPVAETRTGALVWALPVDILYWNEQLDQAVSSLKGGAGGRDVVLLVPGIVSERAQRMLAERGVTAHGRFLYRR